MQEESGDDRVALLLGQPFQLIRLEVGVNVVGADVGWQHGGRADLVRSWMNVDLEGHLDGVMVAASPAAALLRRVDGRRAESTVAAGIFEGRREEQLDRVGRVFLGFLGRLGNAVLSSLQAKLH